MQQACGDSQIAQTCCRTGDATQHDRDLTPNVLRPSRRSTPSRAVASESSRRPTPSLACRYRDNRARPCPSLRALPPASDLDPRRDRSLICLAFVASAAAPPRGKQDSVIHRLVALSLKHRLLVLLGAIGLMAWGIWAVYRTPVDAIPDCPTTRSSSSRTGRGAVRRKSKIRSATRLTTSLQGLAGVRVVRSQSAFGSR